MRAIIVDDEKNAVSVLEKLLEQYCTGITIIAKCYSGPEAVEQIKKLKPDVVFLDIEMPHKNGFDVINETREVAYRIIFTTAYNEFAIKAFKVSAVDYLLKPIDILELKEAVEKTKTSAASYSIDEKLKLLLSNIRTEPRVSKVALPVGDSMQFFEASDILRCESASNYTHIYLTNTRKLTVAKTLKDVEDALDGLGFFRVHNSHIVNMAHITKILKGDSGYLQLSDGSTVAISRSKRDAFMESFRKI